MSLEDRYRRELKQISDNNLLRQDVIYPGSDFISNDYLSLKQNREYLSCLSEADDLPATGSTGSRYLSGYHRQLEECESRLADFYSVPGAFLFSAGYLANTAVFPALSGANDIILYDEFCHASLKDGIRLSLAKSFPWRHLDLEDLRDKIKRLRPKRGSIFIVCESVYSMDGDRISLAEVLQLCESEDAWLVIDEAHSVGLLGQQGKGIASANTSPRLLCAMAGFGKAFALSGGALLFHNKTAADYFSQKARPLIYSTAPSPRFCRQLFLAHDFFSRRQNELYRALTVKLNLFADCAQANGFPGRNDHPIQILKINRRDIALSLAKFLRDNTIAAKAIVPPTVRAGSERLRLIVHRNNSELDIKNLWRLTANFLKNVS